MIQTEKAVMKSTSAHSYDRLPAHPESRRSSRRVAIASFAALLASLFVIVPIEWQHWAFTFAADRPLVAWMAAFNADTSFYLFWLLVLPIFYSWRFHLTDPHSDLAVRVESWLQAGKFVAPSESANSSTTPCDPIWLRHLTGLLIAMLGLFCAAQTGQRFGDLPPAYHDEYSYLFQAETFALGRITNDRFEAAPELFDQMHILNDYPGKFASRYFPGAGLWLLPFVSLGIPYWGYFFAQGVICLLIFWIGRDLSGNGTGLLAGLLCALAPGLNLFGNMLLAHHPCLVGLLFFLFTFHRWAIRKQYRYAFLAGIGLIYAMYCRPMTAFGIGLPYGIWYLVSVLKAKQWNLAQKTKQLLAIGIPVFGGLLLMLPYNAKITGNALETPYSQYTKLHTPRHQYGFHNRSRGEKWIARHQQAGNPLPVIEHYDRWAEELTLELAIKNEKHRLIASSQWTLGIIPTLAGIVFFCVIGQKDRKQWWALAAAIFSLHLVHIPYWYDGIMHWHYVFESAPLLVLIFARSTQLLTYNARIRERHWCAIWWIGLPLISLMISYTTFEPFWNSSMSAGISELKFARQQHDRFNKLLNNQINEKAVVFIKKKTDDLHLDFVINKPELNSKILRAHWLPEKYSVAQLQKLFPDRALYLADLSENRLLKLSTEEN